MSFECFLLSILYWILWYLFLILVFGEKNIRDHFGVVVLFLFCLFLSYENDVWTIFKNICKNIHSNVPVAIITSQRSWTVSRWPISWITSMTWCWPAIVWPVWSISNAFGGLTTRRIFIVTIVSFLLYAVLVLMNFLAFIWKLQKRTFDLQCIFKNWIYLLIETIYIWTVSK